MSSATVGRPCGSRIVVTTPLGLCNRRYVDSGGGATRNAVNLDAVTLVDERCQLGDDSAINVYRPGRNQFVGMPARGNSRLRQIFIKPNAGHFLTSPRQGRRG